MRAYGNAKFRGHQQDGKVLVDPAHTATIDLTEIKWFGLHELFEEHTVLAMFARGYFYRGNGFANSSMTKHIIRTGWLFDPQWVEASQLLHAFNSGRHIPFLIGIHHQKQIVSDFFADNRCPSNVVLQVRAYFHFDVLPSFCLSFTTESPDFFIGITKPSCRRSVCGIAFQL